MTSNDTDAREPVHSRKRIAELLERPEFVEWDRFTVQEHEDGQIVTVYGWIDREDEYKDFVWARFFPDADPFWMDYTTSSEEYSEELTRIWYGEDSVEGHNECRRVEDAFEIENAVELSEQAELVTDGGSNAGLYQKYEVYEDGEPVEDCFVLEPENDETARLALRMYAEKCGDPELAEDLHRWMDELEGSA